MDQPWGPQGLHLLLSQPPARLLSHIDKQQQMECPCAVTQGSKREIQPPGMMAATRSSILLCLPFFLSVGGEGGRRIQGLYVEHVCSSLKLQSQLPNRHTLITLISAIG